MILIYHFSYIPCPRLSNQAAIARRRCTLAAAGALLALSALPTLAKSSQAGQSTVKVSHASGTITVAAPPRKIVVLDLTSFDTLAVLGVDVAGVPDSPMPQHLAHFKHAANPAHLDRRRFFRRAAQAL